MTQEGKKCIEASRKTLRPGSEEDMVQDVTEC